MLYTCSSAVFGSASCKVPSASVYGCVLLTTSAERQTLGGPRTGGTDSWLDDADKIAFTVETARGSGGAEIEFGAF